MTKIVLEGAQEMAERMRAYPQELQAALTRFVTAALLLVWESLPPYPPQEETVSGYVRTGTLGRSIGIGGGAQGASIYKVTQHGSGMVSGEFGTNLEYAQHVIGDASTQQSAEMARRNWWTLPQTVFNAAAPKIEEQWERFIQQIAAWIEGKGGPQ